MMPERALRCAREVIQVIGVIHALPSLQVGVAGVSMAAIKRMRSRPTTHTAGLHRHPTAQNIRPAWTQTSAPAFETPLALATYGQNEDDVEICQKAV